MRNINKICINKYELENEFDDLQNNKPKFVYLDFYPKYLKMIGLQVTDEEIEMNTDNYFISVKFAESLREGFVYIQVDEEFYTLYLQAVSKKPIRGGMVYQFEEIID